MIRTCYPLLGKRWTACGVRLSGEQIIGYQYGYLSVALNPRTGEMFVLLLPDMRKELRKELKNRVFESFEAVEEAVIKTIEPFFKDGSRVKS